MKELQNAKQTTIDIRIYFSDTDALGIVYHANYLDFAERARYELTREYGIDLLNFAQKKQFLVLKSANIEYHSPAVLDDLISVTAFVSGIGRTSMEVTHNMINKKTGKKVCDVKCILVFVDMISGSPVPTLIPEELKILIL